MIAGLGMVVSVAAGCSGGDSEGASDESAAAVTTVEDGSFTCAMSGEYRPFNFFDDAGDLVGFDVDICSAIAAELGLEPAPVTGPFNTLLAGLQSDRYDAIVGSMSATDERREQVDFTEPYYETGAQLFVSEGSSITGVDDLDDATVGVALGTTFEEYARDLPGVSDVTTYQADVDALRDLEAGRVDAVITQGFMGLYLAKNADIGIVAVGDPLFPDVASIAVSKSNPELLAAVDEALVEIREDGTYSEISNEWFGEDLS